MKNLFHQVSVLLIVILSLDATTQKLNAQAMTMGNEPSFAPLNLSKSKIIDTLQIEVRYQFEWKYAGQSSIQKDLRTIQIGKSYIFSRNESLYQNDSISTSLIKKGAKGVHLYNKPTVAYEVLIDRTKKTFELGYRVPYDKLLIFFSAPLPKFKWNIEPNKQKKILGYTCHEATTTYQGKKFEAWYCEELPINAGPYYFSGLPGLILAVSSDDFSWTAVGIVKGNNQDIVSYGRPKQKMNKKETIQFVKKIYSDPVAVFSALGVECYSSASNDRPLSSGSIKWSIPEVILFEQ